MKGYYLNPDENVVNRVIEGLRKKDGHCPCRIKVDDTTLCPYKTKIAFVNYTLKRKKNK